MDLILDRYWYRYVPQNMTCMVTKVYPDRHRCRVKLENEQEIDEVSWHEVVLLTPMEVPQTQPEASSALVPEVSSEAALEDQGMGEDGETGDDRLRRGRRLWPQA